MEKQSIYERSVEMHRQLKGKIGLYVERPIKTQEDLSLAYTPGVAEPCKIIKMIEDEVYELTWKQNSVAVVTDGSAVLGLGNIGPKAALPVMEGKVALLKEFGNVNAVPICLDTQDTEEIIRTVKAIAPAFGGILLEDISAPRCVEIERRLIKELDIPVFHDDQHGTAIVVTAAIMNAAYIVGKPFETLTIVVSGTGVAGSAIIKILHKLGVKEIFAFDINGIISKRNYDKYNPVNQEISQITNSQCFDVPLRTIMPLADVFVGVSAPNILTPEMVRVMKHDPIVFAMANPEPEITYEAAKEAGARVVGTGRSDYPNQINNLLAFPGVFRGALDCRAKRITEEMKMEAAYALASLISNDELCEEYIIPSPFNPKVPEVVAKAVMTTAKRQEVARKIVF